LDAIAALHLVNRLYARLDARRTFTQTCEDYYAGKQPLSFATEEWRKANAARYAGFSDNWTRPVVDAENERIRHTGIKLGDDTKASQKLWDQWLFNDMEAQSSQGFVTTLSTSRSFVLVWGDSDDQPLNSWEHPSSVEIEYDWGNRRKRVAALKTWADDKFEFANLYTADEVWKFERERTSLSNIRDSQADQARVLTSYEGGWEPREVAGEVWPLPHPLGAVPIVEVPNRPMLAGDPISEIAGVMPMQDAINLLWAYLFLAADYASMPARVVLHQGPPKMPVLDSDGKQVGEKPVDIKDLAEKRLLYLSGADTAIDSWEAAKLDVFTGVIEKAVGHIAAQTRTPPTYLVTTAGMSNVNGEGLKASEIGLVKKTLEFQTFATPAMREIHRLNAKAMGDDALAELARKSTIAWANPEIRSEAQLADALLKKKQMGYPLEYLMELDGMDPLDIERVMDMRERELKAALDFGVEEALNDGDAVNEPAV
jgi:hypothetical protein